jgi:hypothetical protein
MRFRSGVFLCLCALAPLRAAARVLPEACGEEGFKFKVTVQKGAAPMPAPVPGKARLVFIETLDKHGVLGPAPTVRYAVDGGWVGANKGDSYFILDVDPGVHQVCANWQAVNTTGRNFGLAQLNAAADHTYYFEAAILEAAESAGPPGAPGSQNWTDIQFHFVPVPEQQAQYRLRDAGWSTFTSK